MDSFDTVKTLARKKHTEMRAKSGGAVTASALLTSARTSERITTRSVPPDHPLLVGGDGALYRDTCSIYISTEASPEEAAYIEAHEFGHLWIETPADPVVVPRGYDSGAPEEPTPLGLYRVEAYSAQELRERYANVFSREFLLPREEARRWFLEGGYSAIEISRELGIPIGLVYQQLAIALLLPEIPDRNEESDTKEKPGLDSSQKIAAEHDGTPLLVEAGPGTGKTRTLISRVEHLLSRGVPAPSILILTFSNKAAQEIRERIAVSTPKAAAELWAGTFHAFGLELLRKFGHLVDIEEPVRLFDQADALALLEQELPNLGLDHYLRLHEPLLELRHILSAISRAKDEVFSPADYAAAAVRMQAAALNEEERLKADKAAEVAQVYDYYERKMRAAGVVDFADLINRPIEILCRHSEVRDEIRAQYRHVLVDEYQDINRASALLLKELAGDGARLWVVGDARQSIYRFRGAAPINTRDFEKDYPTGERKALAVNYRSKKQIVDLFGAYADRMKVGRGLGSALNAQRGDGAEAVDCHIAADGNAEVAGIAATIRKHREKGIAYRDQAVLCRSHGNLEKIALGLEQAGVPVLYLGDLFERPEVRDLLALLSFVAEPHRGGLYRVATLAPYRTPIADVRTFLVYAAAIEKTPLSALAEVDSVDGLSDEGLSALLRLGADLRSVTYKTGPGVFLCDFLFNRSTLLRACIAGDTAADQQRRLAIHQFLQFAIENDKPGDSDPKRKLLDWVRRLEVFGDERALREPPTAVAGIDAVRLMTVHASKGLEFRVVHLPTLGAGMFPLRWQGERCPVPHGMLTTVVADDHKEEEECLFFVALSRARDHLSLSRAERYSDRQNSNTSEALKTIARFLPRSPEGAPTWTVRFSSSSNVRVREDLGVPTREHDGRDIDVYLNCPCRYLYQVVLGLSGSREDNGYVRFHRAVYKILRWMNEQTADIQKSVNLLEKFDVHWTEIGPVDHPLEPLYRAAAERILIQAGGRSLTGIRVAEILNATIDGHTIRLQVDEIESGCRGSFVVRRLRTGRPSKTPDHRTLHALMAEAGKQTLGPGGRFELQYLTTNEAVEISFARVMDSRLNKCREALAGIAAGYYPAIPNNREDCPRCPQYFICSAIPE
jgi:DNA helicase-2/ATP-dependent DNA helicase PcrA